MKTRTKLAVAGLVVASLAATAGPALAAGKASTLKSSGNLSQPMDRPAHGGPLNALVTAGTITQVQADAVETATRTAMQTAEQANMNAALAALVKAGTITQAQADAVTAAAPTTPGPRHRLELSTWTEAQRDALRTWLDANPIDRAAIAKAALAKLVTAGTVTQTQTDAINTALAAGPAGGRGPGAEGERGHGRGPGHGPGEGRGHGRGHGDGPARGPLNGMTPPASTTSSTNA